MKYDVISDGDLIELTKEINKLLTKGWVCQGGITITINGEWKYYQAMIKTNIIL